MTIRFDHGPTGADTGFDQPLRLLRADSPDQVNDVLAAMDHARADGFWLAGFASYELGYVLEPKLLDRLPKARKLPLICFGVYKEPVGFAPLSGAGHLDNLQPGWSAQTYKQAFQKVHDAIGAGDIYQANLTFPIAANRVGPLEGLYTALKQYQPVRHGAFVTLPDLPPILSRSPELFFRTDAAGMIETLPMKGTLPRSDNPAEDARRKAWLAQDEKNCAENLMIVDLLRNDISRVALPGSVTVPELFKVESYSTVHQMVSRVRALLRPDVTLSDILRALFPCGSITGAPKIRAMEILSELEPDPRDIYCGSIGWAAPDGRSEFNVAIRTLTDYADKTVFNVGGGVVWDSTATAEYEEALWKARFAQLSPSFA